MSDVAQLKAFIKICNKNSITEHTQEAEQNSASNPIAVNLTGMRRGLCLQSKQAMDTRNWHEEQGWATFIEISHHGQLAPRDRSISISQDL